jgi:hypothetical protein
MGQDFLEQFTEKLEAHALEKDLVARALANCDAALKHCAEVEIELKILPLNGWRPDQIKKRFVKHALVFHYEGKSFPYIDTVIDLYVMVDHDIKKTQWERSIGYYRYLTTSTGECDDDVLDLDVFA